MLAPSDAFASFARANPKARLITRIGTLEEVQDLVRTQAATLGLVLSTGPVAGLQSEMLAHEIGLRTQAETRVTVLGHVQRGGSPTPLDRVLASAFGVYAVDLVAAGRFDRMVAWQHRRVVDVAIKEAVAQYQAVDPHDALVVTARGLGISFGDRMAEDEPSRPRG